MDAAQIISTVLGTGGILTGLVAWYKAKSTKQVGLSGVEVQDKAVATADWSAWQEYWPEQIKELREQSADLRSRVNKLEQDRDDDAQHIEDLKAWIWAGKPPPPPERRRRDPPT